MFCVLIYLHVDFSVALGFGSGYDLIFESTFGIKSATDKKRQICFGRSGSWMVERCLEPKNPTCTQKCDGASLDGLYIADNQFVLMLLFVMVLYDCMLIIWLWAFFACMIWRLSDDLMSAAEFLRAQLPFDLSRSFHLVSDMTVHAAPI